MAWAKIDDQLHGHPKIKAAWRASRAAVGLHLLSMSYCSAYGTGGVVPCEFVEEQLPNEEERAIALSALTAVPAMARSPLWHEVDGGWRIHDWDEYNGDAKGRERTREAKSRAGKAGAAARWRNGRAMAGVIDSANGKTMAPYPSPYPRESPNGDSACASNARPAPDDHVEDLTDWPDDLPSHLQLVGERVLAGLRRVAAAKSTNPPIRAQVGRTLADFPDHDHATIVGEFEDYWLFGAGSRTRRRDIARTYRHRCSQLTARRPATPDTGTVAHDPGRAARFEARRRTRQAAIADHDDLSPAA